VEPSRIVRQTWAKSGCPKGDYIYAFDGTVFGFLSLCSTIPPTMIPSLPLVLLLPLALLAEPYEGLEGRRIHRELKKMHETM
jgi:hypothetical protein